MNSHKKMAASLAAAVGFGVTMLGGTAAIGQAPPPPGVRARLGMGVRERHPELRRALRTLERVETQLRKSARDFGGHREKAADLCHQAEQEIQLALQSDR